MKRLKKIELQELTGNRYEDMNQYANETDVVSDFSDHIREYTSVDYSKVDNLTKQDYKNRTIHHQKAGKEAENGAYVLRINIAGSGLNHWPKMHKGLTGYNEVEKFVEAENEPGNENDSFNDAVQKNSHKKYRIHGEPADIQNTLKERVRDEYGEPLYLTEKGEPYHQKN